VIVTTTSTILCPCSLVYYHIALLFDIPYLGAGVTVAATVAVPGTRRYDLQKEEAGGPNPFKTPRTPVTTLQFTFTLRGEIRPPVARAAQEAGAIKGAQLISTVAAVTEKSE